jgi:hypothetical protein
MNHTLSVITLALKVVALDALGVFRENTARPCPPAPTGLFRVPRVHGRDKEGIERRKTDFQLQVIEMTGPRFGRMRDRSRNMSPNSTARSPHTRKRLASRK